MVFVVVMHAADMERVARILATHIAAPIGIDGKTEIEPTRNEAARRAQGRLGLCRP